MQRSGQGLLRAGRVLSPAAPVASPCCRSSGWQGIFSGQERGPAAPAASPSASSGKLQTSLTALLATPCAGWRAWHRSPPHPAPWSASPPARPRVPGEGSGPRPDRTRPHCPWSGNCLSTGLELRAGGRGMQELARRGKKGSLPGRGSLWRL